MTRFSIVEDNDILSGHGQLVIVKRTEDIDVRQAGQNIRTKRQDKQERSVYFALDVPCPFLLITSHVNCVMCCMQMILK